MRELETPKGISIDRMFLNAWSEAGTDLNVFFKHNHIVVMIIQDHGERNDEDI